MSKPISIADYNADPTGNRSSSIAFRSAIESLTKKNGGTLFIPSGTYLLDESISIYSISCTILGENQGNTELLFSKKDNAGIYYKGSGYNAKNQVSHFTISELSLVTNDLASQPALEIDYPRDGAKLSRYRVENISIKGRLIYTNNSRENKSHWKYGLQINNAHNGIIRGVQIIGSSGYKDHIEEAFDPQKTSDPESRTTAIKLNGSNQNSMTQSFISQVYITNYGKAMKSVGVEGIHLRDFEIVGVKKALEVDNCYSLYINAGHFDFVNQAGTFGHCSSISIFGCDFQNRNELDSSSLHKKHPGNFIEFFSCRHVNVNGCFIQGFNTHSENHMRPRAINFTKFEPVEGVSNMAIISNCSFRSIDGDAINFGEGARRNMVVGCLFESIGLQKIRQQNSADHNNEFGNYTKS